MFRIGKTVTAGVAGSHQVIVERYGGLMRSAARPPLGSLSTELEKMASGWRSHSPSLLFRMALKAAALAADCEELWKDDCGNADTRGPLQLSGKADKKEADSDQFSVKSNHFTNVRSHRLHSWKQQGAEKKKKEQGSDSLLRPTNDSSSPLTPAVTLQRAAQRPRRPLAGFTCARSNPSLLDYIMPTGSRLRVQRSKAVSVSSAPHSGSELL